MNPRAYFEAYGDREADKPRNAHKEGLCSSCADWYDEKPEPCKPCRICQEIEFSSPRDAGKGIEMKYRYRIVDVQSRSWRWGRRAELRIRDASDPRPLYGRGCYDGSVVHEVDRRYRGPQSRLGQLLDKYGLRGQPQDTQHEGG